MEINPQLYINLLLAQGLNESQIAKETDISQSTIHRIKRGNTRNPRLDTLLKLHQFLLKMQS